MSIPILVPIDNPTLDPKLESIPIPYTTPLNPDYVIGFLRPDKVRGDACPVFTGSVAIARKSGCLEILA